LQRRNHRRIGPEVATALDDLALLRVEQDPKIRRAAAVAVQTIRSGTP
jgi:hypothetical protein